MREPSKSIGRLAPNAVQDSLIEQTIEFVWGCLIPWRNDPDRPFAEGEEELNAQFHNFLQSCANETFPMVLFQHEQRQEGRRRVDLSAKPAKRIVIEGVTYTKYQPILVIEGKRLPAPSRTREREYVSGEAELSGGIQRFKLGLHGKEHATVIILGYLQQGKLKEWHSRINGWISDLARNQPNDWANHEVLAAFSHHHEGKKARAASVHPRLKECKTPEIQILHFWVQLTPTLRTTTQATKRNFQG
jgi:hypothetical protein